jgi:hypothetical protein
MSKQEHAYAQVLRWIADGDDVEVRYGDGTWDLVGSNDALSQLVRNSHRSPDDFRLKPRTIKIGDFGVPEPMRVAPQISVFYWVADPDNNDLAFETTWDGDPRDRQRLARGICHTTREAAETHAKALLSFTTTEQS